MAEVIPNLWQMKVPVFILMVIIANTVVFSFLPSFACWKIFFVSVLILTFLILLICDWPITPGGKPITYSRNTDRPIYYSNFSYNANN